MKVPFLFLLHTCEAFENTPRSSVRVVQRKPHKKPAPEENATQQAAKRNVPARDTTENLPEEALAAATAAPKKKAAVQRKPNAAAKAAPMADEATPAPAQLVQQNVPKESAPEPKKPAAKRTLRPRDLPQNLPEESMAAANAATAKAAQANEATNRAHATRRATSITADNAEQSQSSADVTPLQIGLIGGRRLEELLTLDEYEEPPQRPSNCQKRLQTHGPMAICTCLE